MAQCETLLGNQSSNSYYRTCHVGWVDDSSSETSALLSRRMADMSNLNLDFSEVNQLANYGLGGEFQLHFDALENVRGVITVVLHNCIYLIHYIYTLFMI